MLSMRDILIVRDTFVLIKVRGIICRSGIEEWNQRLLKKDSIVFTHPSAMLLSDHLEC